ncbi:uncharacterized protein LOC117791033 [Drosophila innubila]|nr:uncharacterized protein LOC117791033 [Drosophila innubila]
MAFLILTRLTTFCTQLSNFIKTNSPFVIEALMVCLCFGSIISRYFLLT